jgi:penicillin-binding protein 2
MKNTESRKFVISFIFILTGFIFLIRLLYVQVFNNKYKLDSANNVLRYITDYPARGLIYDRSNTLLVYNEAAYDLMVIPRQLKSFDTLQFCELIGTSKENLVKKLTKARAFSSRKPSVFEKEISSAAYAKIQEELYNFPGFYVQTRTLRNYPMPIAGHLLGYISEVDERIIANNPYYKSGDNIGRSGLEKSYEKYLRGKRGVRIVMVDVFNRAKGRFEDGRYDTLAVAGKDIVTTIDADLQRYGEALMKNKKGSIVAIDPATGEILAIVTNPAYDPNLLVGRVRSKNYQLLERDTLKPLFNRALMAMYPPGSTFKLINALIGLQEGVLTPNTHYSCRMGYNFRGFHMGCHGHASPVDLEFSIQTSCNAYYCNVFRSIVDHYPTAEKGYNVWKKHVNGFGLGSKTGVDLPSELRGNVPESTYYDRYYGKGHWNSLTVISLAIGQGELGITPIQMANVATTIANKGYYITPHAVRSVDDIPIELIDSTIQKHQSAIQPEYFEEVRNAMYKVVEEGTGRSAKIDTIMVCGKTGTVENPHGADHSTFLAFAPLHQPKIAISVYVENGVWGSRWAAPIAGLMIEKYLRGTVSRPHIEERMLNGNLIQPE